MALTPKTYQKAPEREPPRLLRKPQVTLDQLVRGTAMDDRQKSATVRLAEVKEMRPPAALREFRVMRGRTQTAENRHQHTARVFFAGEALAPDSKVICDCTCPRHAYYYEAANAKRGASFIYRSNGAPPSTTNPGNRLGLCKHLYRLTSYLLRQAGGGKATAPRGKTGR